MAQDVESIDIVKRYEKTLPVRLTLIESKPSPGAARNILIQKSNAKYLFFLDDDATLPKNYLSDLEDLNIEFDILGGTDSSNSRSLDQDVLGLILANKWIMGPTAARHNVGEDLIKNVDETQLTSCHLWIRRNFLIENELKFPENLGRCEENILLSNMLEKGAKSYLYKKLTVYHERREGFYKQASIQFHSGYYRGYVMSFHSAMRKKFFLSPLATGSCLIFLPLLPSSISINLIRLHILLCWIIGFENILELKNIKSFFKTWYYISIIHVFFSIGITFGFLKGKVSFNGK